MESIRMQELLAIATELFTEAYEGGARGVPPRQHPPVPGRGARDRGRGLLRARSIDSELPAGHSSDGRAAGQNVTPATSTTLA